MRKFLLSTAMSMAAVVCFAQGYYYIPNINAGENPGNLNNDAEQVATILTGLGWTQVLNSAASGWSANQTVPFSFEFNGSSETEYKISPSGVLTFNVAAAAVPSSANQALPSALIPDKSVCVWGFDLSGANDGALTKTFGTAPNRQHWIRWASATDPALSGTQWVYMAIVLEETTNNIYVIDERVYNANGGNVTLTVGVQINGATAVQVAGSPNIQSGTTATSGNGDDATDNSYWEFIPGVQIANDAGISSVSPANGSQESYGAVGAPKSISGTIKNFGSNAISAVDVKWSDGVNTYTNSLTGLNITSGGTYNFNHTDQLTPVIGNNPVDVWVELAGDGNSGNDMMSTTIVGVSFLPTNAIVFEEATGTWCGWCPRGSVFMDSMAHVHPDAILIAVHNADPMVDAPYDAGINGFIGGYPSVVVDRSEEIDPSEMFTGYNARSGAFGFADITVTPSFNSGTREATVAVDVKAAVDLTGNYRLALVFTENGVTGTGDGSNANNQDYDQVNYYSFQSQNLPLVGAGHNWQASTNPVPATDLVYDFVARTILGGFTGQSGSLPGSMTAGNTYSYNFSYTVPAGFKENNMKAIALLINQANGEILNGGQANLGAVGIGTTPVAELGLFPNPTSDALRISISTESADDITVTLTSMLGSEVQHVYSGSALNAQSIIADVSHLESGMYVVTVASRDGMAAKTFTKQ